MDMDVYFKKIYTVAFRLTGDKKIACELAMQAILKMDGKKDANNMISDCILKNTALEACRLFLEKYDTCSDELNFDYHRFINSKNEIYEIQKVLSYLNSVDRIIIVWKDLLGFQLSDLEHILNKDKTELNTALSHARMLIKQNFDMQILF